MAMQHLVRLKFLKAALIASVLFYLPLQSMAWGMLGHRIVGEIASFYLSKKAQRGIREILGTESIAMASNYGDFIKSDPAFKGIDPWHYTNLKGGMTAQDIRDYLQKDTATDSYTRINFLVAELKKKDLPQDKKVFYLKMLIHIAGDLSQPMHTARPEDLGGNKIKVMWFSTPSNLHRVWDEQLIEYQQLSYTEYAKVINFVPKDTVKAWQQASITDCIVEANQLTEQLYAEITQPDQKLGYRYNFDHVKTLNEQLLKGGIRLAGLLNEVFK